MVETNTFLRWMEHKSVLERLVSDAPLLLHEARQSIPTTLHYTALAQRSLEIFKAEQQMKDLPFSSVQLELIQAAVRGSNDLARELSGKSPAKEMMEQQLEEKISGWQKNRSEQHLIQVFAVLKQYVLVQHLRTTLGETAALPLPFYQDLVSLAVIADTTVASSYLREYQQISCAPDVEKFLTQFTEQFWGPVTQARCLLQEKYALKRGRFQVPKRFLSATPLDFSELGLYSQLYQEAQQLQLHLQHSPDFFSRLSAVSVGQPDIEQLGAEQVEHQLAQAFPLYYAGQEKRKREIKKEKRERKERREEKEMQEKKYEPVPTYKSAPTMVAETVVIIPPQIILPQPISISSPNEEKPYFSLRSLLDVAYDLQEQATHPTLRSFCSLLAGYDGKEMLAQGWRERFATALRGAQQDPDFLKQLNLQEQQLYLNLQAGARECISNGV